MNQPNLNHGSVAEVMATIRQEIVQEIGFKHLAEMNPVMNAPLLSECKGKVLAYGKVLGWLSDLEGAQS